MALTTVHANSPADAYIGGLRAVIASISPILLSRDRWGFLTLQDAFAIDETSQLYSASNLGTDARQIRDKGSSDYFLR